MSIGPVEYLLMEFPDKQIHRRDRPGPAAPDRDPRTVRIIDLVFIRKDADGTTTTLEFDQLDEYAPRHARRGGRRPARQGGHRLCRRRASAKLLGRPARVKGHLSDRVGGGHPQRQRRSR